MLPATPRVSARLVHAHTATAAAVRAQFKVGIKASSLSAAQNGVTRVVTHMRRGDAAGRGVPTIWYWQTLGAVIMQLLQQKHSAKVQLWVHSDDPSIYTSFMQSPAQEVMDERVIVGGMNNFFSTRPWS